ncbi:hypothetical protein Geezett_063 [Klebsiella phage Geezett]|uniref:Uncharacterized protein n=1 Tax=Klebsiella phage Geezett TaxID=2861002 RepID=A0AAE8AUL7_9CAUD|nr:hypothetical protein PQZ59_gp63 [Klebsiella phage Geezett]QXV72135.1 hypothetical protein Geezett_063 [Klebsiella phage Geezett]
MSNITLTIPNDDTIALRQFGKALIEIASEKDGHPVDVTVTPLVISTDVDIEERLRVATEELRQAAPRMMQDLRIDGTAEIHGKRKEPEVDTTAQQVESLATIKPFEERLGLLDKALTKETPESLAEKLQSYNPEPTTDSTGTPWDERIHSASKALNADGTWRLRRKPKDMDEEEWVAFVESVKGELHTQTPVMTDEEVKTLEPVEIGEPTREEVDDVEPPVTPPGDDFHTDTDVVTEQTVAGIPPIPVPPPVVVAPPVPEVTEWDFPRLMTFLTERHGKIDVATVNTLLAQDGISSVQELNAHPDKIGPFVARVKAHLGE